MAVSVGLDLSLTSAGIALVGEAGGVSTVAVGEKGRAGASWGERGERIERQAVAILEHVPEGAFVVVEGPSYGSFSTSTWDRAGLWHRVVAGCRAKGCKVSVAAPTNAKLFLAGHAHAGKRAMVAMARLNSGLPIGTDDEADAYALAMMGRARLDGHDLPGMGGVEWDG